MYSTEADVVSALRSFIDTIETLGNLRGTIKEIHDETDELVQYEFQFFAGLITALATGLGAIPFFFVQSISTRWKSTLWGLAGGIMVAPSVFGLILEAGKYGTAMEITIGILVGIGLVVLGNRLLENAQIDPKDYAEADYRKLMLILGILTIHSFPEGVAVGVSFAELDFSTGISLLGLTVPVLGLFIEFVAEALTIGRDMPYSGYLETSIGFLAGISIMLPFLFF